MAEELAYCVPLGLPHSEFLSWSDEDQDKALAFLRVRAETCACGTRREEWDNDRFAFVAESYTCPGCEVLEMEHDNIDKDRKGVKTYLQPRAIAEARIAAGVADPEHEE